MNTKTSLAILLIAMLLTSPLQAINWQGTGSGLNNTVMTEIWTDLSAKVDAAIIGGNQGKNNFAYELSQRLNARWDPAWNVVYVSSLARFDAILYGYAFNDQWMWYNGVPNSKLSITIITLIVWKDYNCQSWAYIGAGATGVSSFTTAQKAAIREIMDDMTPSSLQNHIWGTAFTMMDRLQSLPDFSSGGYTVIMAQDGSSNIFGRVCRVGDGYYYSTTELNNNPILRSPTSLGNFYLFQTR